MVRTSHLRPDVRLLAVLSLLTLVAGLLSSCSEGDGGSCGDGGKSPTEAVTRLLKAVENDDVEEACSVSNYESTDGLAERLTAIRERLLNRRKASDYSIREAKSAQLGSGKEVALNLNGKEVYRFRVIQSGGRYTVGLRSYKNTDTPTSGVEPPT